MVAQRESSVPRTSKVQSDDVALYKSLLERSKVVQEGILLGNFCIVTVDVDAPPRLKSLRRARPNAEHYLHLSVPVSKVRRLSVTFIP